MIDAKAFTGFTFTYYNAKHFVLGSKFGKRKYQTFLQHFFKER